MEEASPARRPDRLSWALFALLATVYRWGRCPSFGPDDSPGVVRRALEGGRDPLALCGRFAAKLPLDTPWGWVNALSGLLHAGAAALLFALLRRLGLRRAPAAAAALLLAFLPRYWYYALVAGSAPAAVFGLALAAWSVVAWKEDGRARPLLFGAAGAALLAWYAPRSVTLVPAALWLAALGAGLLLQRLDLASPGAALGALGAALLLPLARPYDARRHNPTLEYARAVAESAGPGARVFVYDRTVYDALKLAGPATLDVLLNDGPLEVDVRDLRPSYDEAVFFRGADFRWVPRGLLVPREEKAAPGDAEIARRAEAALALPALTSVGRRDLAKYGFTGERVLYDRYRVVLSRYRALLGPGHDDLARRLEAQLADYGPAPR